MLYTYPHYYKKFQCIASECEDTCCAGWEIMIDDRALEKYKRTKGPIGNRLKNSINWKEGSFLQYHHRCAFLNDENLCDLYTEMGPDSLCRTCRMYPRHVEEFEGSREYSLCLSCMEAARIILGCEEKVRFLTKEDEKDENYDEFDVFWYTKLMDARDLIFKILQDRNIDVSLRMAEVLALSHDLQRRVRDRALYQADELLERYESPKRDLYFKEKLSQITEYSRYEVVKEIFVLLEKMEPLNHQWPEYRENLKACLVKNGKAAYEENRKRFLESPEAGKMELWTEQLMVYFVYTYFCGSVYNENPYGKMKAAVVSTIMIQDMMMAYWMEHKSLTLKEAADAAHRYSREIEHSDENKWLLEDTLTCQGEFRLRALLAAFQK